MIQGWGIVKKGHPMQWWRGKIPLCTGRPCDAILFLRRKDAEEMRLILDEPDLWFLKIMEVLA